MCECFESALAGFDMRSIRNTQKLTMKVYTQKVFANYNFLIPENGIGKVLETPM